MKNISTEKNIRCFIIDDEIEARKVLNRLLMMITNIDVVGSDEASDEAIKLVANLKPDIVFMDVEMPRINGFELVKQIRSLYCYPTFIFVTAFNQYAIKAIKNAAFDFLLKPVDIEELTRTIDRFRDKFSAGNKAYKTLPGFGSLNKREKEVLELMLNGFTSKEIAEKLFISKNTVNTHRRNILNKLNATSTIELFKLL